MARNKTAKVTISLEHADIIKNMAGDIAIEENRSISSVIEEIVLHGLLPYPSNIRWLILEYLYDNDGINKVLSSIFDINSAGQGWQSIHDNLCPLVDYGLQQAAVVQTKIDNNNTSSIQYVCTQMRALINILDNLAGNADNAIQSITYRSEIDWATAITNDLEKEPEFSKLSNFYQFLLNNWEAVKNLSVTYRLLSMLVSMDSWANNAHTRVALLDVIRRVTCMW